jgi:hypothetical protein
MPHKIQLPPIHNMAEMRDRLKMRAKLEALAAPFRKPKHDARGTYIRSKHTRQLMSLAHKARWAKWRAERDKRNAKSSKTVVITITITLS